MSERCIGETRSVCPVCLKNIAAKKIRVDETVYLTKQCEEHGAFQVPIWDGGIDYDSWGKGANNSTANGVNSDCPHQCGLCEHHRQPTCCVLVEVTRRCNLLCPICFADAKASDESDISLPQLTRLFQNLMAAGGPYNIQLSGGEPTVRDDLAQIITIGKDAGFSFFQLNTNGIRIAQDLEYLKKLCEAGLSCIFLQFDGLNDRIYKTIRGRALLETKMKAIENCKLCGIGVVLVPTLVADVNANDVGNILQFALDSLPHVRGVHFQPVSYFGRCESFDSSKRITLPALLQSIEEQTNGRMKIADFNGGGAENPYCSFSGNFILDTEGQIKSWGAKKADCCCSTSGKTEKQRSDRSRAFVAKQWVMPKKMSLATNSLDVFLGRIATHNLAVSCMAFMDCWNLDTQRLKDCYIHVAVQEAENFRLIPFCAYNLTAIGGANIHRVP